MKPSLKNYKTLKFPAIASTLILVCSDQTMAVDITGDTVTTGLTVNGRDVYFGSTSTTEQFRMLWRPMASPNTTQGIFYSDAERQQGQFHWRDDVAVAAKNKMILTYGNALLLYKADGSTVGLELNPESNRLDLKGGGGIYSNGTALLTIGAGSVPTFTRLVTSGDSIINGVNVGTGSGNRPSNTVVGTTALFANTTGTFNSAFGDTSLEVNTSGLNNSAFGAAALADNDTGSNNVGLGVHALSSNTTGGSNIGIGHQAGIILANGTTPMTAPASCVFIGANTKGKLINDSNAIVIGANAVSEGSNTAVIGHTTVTKTYLRGTAYTQNLSVSGSTTLTGATTAGAVTAASMVISGATTANGPVTLNGGASANSLNVSGSATAGALNVTGQAAVNTAVVSGQTSTGSLNVTGATTLNGEVTLAAPQGDISMGIYE
jgi:hypothetical protein